MAQNRSEIQVFICYAKEDLDFAQRLYGDLQRAGVTPWMDEHELLPGEQWEQTIYHAMTSSSFVIALLSSHSLNKRGFVQKELKKAVETLKEFPSSDIFLIPARIENCEPQDDSLRKLQWVDLFHDYEKGLKKILHVVCPEPPSPPPFERELGTSIHRLRSAPLPVSRGEAKKVFKLNEDWRPLKYIENDFEDRDELVFDHATGLIWQKSGSDEDMIYYETQAYVDSLNHSQFAGYNDWRLPTIPELMSLLEPKKQSNRLFFNPIFDRKRIWCWSADTFVDDIFHTTEPGWWYVNFGRVVGVYWAEFHLQSQLSVRCVRSVTN